MVCNYSSPSGKATVEYLLLRRHSGGASKQHELQRRDSLWRAFPRTRHALPYLEHAMRWWSCSILVQSGLGSGLVDVGVRGRNAELPRHQDV